MSLAASFFREAYLPEPNLVVMYGHIVVSAVGPAIVANNVAGGSFSTDQSTSEWLPKSLSVSRSDVGTYFLQAPSPTYRSPGTLLISPGDSLAIIGDHLTYATTTRWNQPGLTRARITFKTLAGADADPSAFDFIWLLPTSGAVRGTVLNSPIV